MFGEDCGTTTGQSGPLMRLKDMKRSTITQGVAERHVVEDRHETYFSHLNEAVAHFNEKLQTIEKRCLDSEERPDDLLHAVTQAIHEMGIACEQFERMVAYDRSLIKPAQVVFREKTAPIFSKSYFMNYARTWPRGYPGDYTILEQIYENAPRSEGIGYYLDQYFLSTVLAVAVRERKRTLVDLLRKELKEKKDLRILDIACGSCSEIVDLASEVVRARATATCIDTDRDALNFSAERLSQVNLASDRVNFYRYNALKMINQERNLKEFGVQEVIYSIGLFDYLKDDVLIALLKSLYQLLADGGTFIVSFKDSRRYTTFDYHWLVSWNAFFQRTEDECRSLLLKARIPAAAVTSLREHSGVIVFFVVTK